MEKTLKLCFEFDRQYDVFLITSHLAKLFVQLSYVF